MGLLEKTRLNMTPSITIVTPSFNQARFLEETLKSVHSQGYPALEHIVIDGGSTDGSVEIIKQYAARLAYWCSESDRGQCHAINKGLARATGEIVGWLNSDDTFEPGALETIARHFAEHPEWGCITGGAFAIDAAGRYLDHNSHVPLDEPRSPRSIRLCPKPRGSECFSFWTRDWFPQPATFWRRSVWEATGPLQEDLHYSMDYELWRRIARVTEIHSVPDVLANCRYHSDCKTIREIWGPLKEVVAVNAAQMDEPQFRQFAVEVSEWLIHRLQHLEQRKVAVAGELEQVRRSPTYRVSQWLSKPWSLMKQCLK